MKKYCGILSLLALALSFSPAHAQNLTITNGLQLWLKADAGVKTNASGGVTTWADQSPNKNDAVAFDDTLAPAFAPAAQNGKPVLRFDGVDDYLEVADAPSIEIAGDISSFFVVNFDDFLTYRAVWAKTSVNLPAPNDYYLLPGSGIARAYRGDGTTVNLGFADATTAVRAGSYVVLGYQMAGTTFTHYLNGQANGSGEITALLGDVASPLKIGTRDDLFTKMKGAIGEILIYDRSLSASERASVVTYLQTKFGIVNVPPTIAITSPALNTTIAAPGVVTLTANAADSDGAIAKVDFFANGALVGTATAAPYKIQLLVRTAGTITLGAVATDNKDATATATNVVITATGSAAGSLTQKDGLQVWLSADAGVTTDAAGIVTAWKDQSGNGNDALPPAPENGPAAVDNVVNGKPALRFDGLDDYLDIQSSDSVAITGDIASFFVVRFTDFATFRAVWGKTVNNVPRPNDYYLASGSGAQTVYRGSDVGNVNQSVIGARIPAGTFALLGFNQVGTAMSHYFNGRVTATGNLTVQPTDGGTPLRVGSRGDLVTKMKGEIAELLIFNKGLTNTTLNAVSDYLASKYGIALVGSSNSLPVVSISAPIAGGSVTAPGIVSITANATDSDGSIVRVDFFANGGFIGTASKAPYKVDFLAPVGGPISLSAVAVDNLGGSTRSAAVAISAAASETSPLPVSTNLALWLKGDAGVAANPAGLVTSWTDFSGNYNNASQADTAASPLLVAKALNNLPVLRFDGVNDYLEAVSTPSLANVGDITSLFVVKYDDFATFRAVWAKTSGNVPRATDYYVQPNSGVPRLLRGGPPNVSADGDAITAGNYVIAGFEISGTTATHYLDGVASVSTDLITTPVDAGATLRIGTRGDNVTRMKGDIAEILIYNSALSDADRDKVTAYLHKKYFEAAPPELKFSGIRTQAKSIVIEWTGAAALEEAASITGPWTAVANASSPLTISTPAQRKFYRLRQ